MCLEGFYHRGKGVKVFLKFYHVMFGCTGSLLLFGVFSSCGEQGFTFVVVYISFHYCGCSCWEVQALGMWDSEFVAHRLSSCGSQALGHGLSSCGTPLSWSEACETFLIRYWIGRQMLIQIAPPEFRSKGLLQIFCMMEIFSKREFVSTYKLLVNFKNAARFFKNI